MYIICIALGGAPSRVVEDLPAYESDGQEEEEEEEDGRNGKGGKNSRHEDEDDVELGGSSRGGSYRSVALNKHKAAPLSGGIVARATRMTSASKPAVSSSKRGDNSKPSSTTKRGGLPIVQGRNQTRASGGAKGRDRGRRSNEPVNALLLPCGQDNEVSELSLSSATISYPCDS